MKKFLVLALFSVLFAGMTMFYSCTKDKAVPPAPLTVCDSTKVSYTKTIKPFIANTCAYAGCHDGNTAGANNLTSLVTLESEMNTDSPDVNSILCRVQGTACGDQMPRYLRPLSAAYIDTLELWKSEGFCN